MPSWLKGPGITKVESEKPGPSLQPGDTIVTWLGESTKFSPVILVNTPDELKWRGSLPYIFTGDHRFQFKASEITPGGTTFMNSEQFSGLFSPLMSEWAMGGSTKKAFEALCEHLKKRVESV